MTKNGNVTAVWSFYAINSIVKNCFSVAPHAALSGVAVLALLAGCASSPMPVYRPVPASTVHSIPSSPAAQSAPSASASTPKRASALPPVATWQQYRLRAASLITHANAAHSFGGKLPDPLHGIPVMQIQLHADGSIRLIDTLRVSKVAPETTQLAIDAIRRAGASGGFGPVGNLPQPWQFNETFLYNEDLKFQLRSLVEGE